MWRGVSIIIFSHDITSIAYKLPDDVNRPLSSRCNAMWRGVTIIIFSHDITSIVTYKLPDDVNMALPEQQDAMSVTLPRQQCGEECTIFIFYHDITSIVTYKLLMMSIWPSSSIMQCQYNFLMMSYGPSEQQDAMHDITSIVKYKLPDDVHMALSAADAMVLPLSPFVHDITSIVKYKLPDDVDMALLSSKMQWYSAIQPLCSVTLQGSNVERSVTIIIFSHDITSVVTYKLPDDVNMAPLRSTMDVMVFALEPLCGSNVERSVTIIIFSHGITSTVTYKLSDDVQYGLPESNMQWYSAIEPYCSGPAQGSNVEKSVTIIIFYHDITSMVKYKLPDDVVMALLSSKIMSGTPQGSIVRGECHLIIFSHDITSIVKYKLPDDVMCTLQSVTPQGSNVEWSVTIIICSHDITSIVKYKLPDDVGMALLSSKMQCVHTAVREPPQAAYHDITSTVTYKLSDDVNMAFLSSNMQCKGPAQGSNVERSVTIIYHDITSMVNHDITSIVKYKLPDDVDMALLSSNMQCVHTAGSDPPQAAYVHTAVSDPPKAAMWSGVSPSSSVVMTITSIVKYKFLMMSSGASPGSIVRRSVTIIFFSHDINIHSQVQLPDDVDMALLSSKMQWYSAIEPLCSVTLPRQQCGEEWHHLHLYHDITSIVTYKLPDDVDMALVSSIMQCVHTAVRDRPRQSNVERSVTIIIFYQTSHPWSSTKLPDDVVMALLSTARCNDILPLSPFVNVERSVTIIVCSHDITSIVKNKLPDDVDYGPSQQQHAMSDITSIVKYKLPDDVGMALLSSKMQWYSAIEPLCVRVN
eukprot:Em1190g1a